MPAYPLLLGGNPRRKRHARRKGKAHRRTRRAVAHNPSTRRGTWVSRSKPAHQRRYKVSFYPTHRVVRTNPSRRRAHRSGADGIVEFLTTAATVAAGAVAGRMAGGAAKKFFIDKATAAASAAAQAGTTAPAESKLTNPALAGAYSAAAGLAVKVAGGMVTKKNSRARKLVNQFAAGAVSMGVVDLAAPHLSKAPGFTLDDEQDRILLAQGQQAAPAVPELPAPASTMSGFGFIERRNGTGLTAGFGV